MNLQRISVLPICAKDLSLDLEGVLATSCALHSETIRLQDLAKPVELSILKGYFLRRPQQTLDGVPIPARQPLHSPPLMMIA